MDADSPTRRPPASWQPNPDAAGSSPVGGSNECRLGFSSTHLARLIEVPDDLAALVELARGAAVPFNGAYVPLVIHLPTEAERSFDAAEWAADLIRTAGGRSLVVAPYAPHHPHIEGDGEGEGGGEGGEGGPANRPLSARQWNHTAAMIERLEVVGRRFAIDLVVSETVGGQQIRPGGGLDPQRPVRHLLDAGGFATDGYQPAELVCPVPVVGQPGALDRLRGIFRDRT